MSVKVLKIVMAQGKWGFPTSDVEAPYKGGGRGVQDTWSPSGLAGGGVLRVQPSEALPGREGDPWGDSLVP